MKKIGQQSVFQPSEAYILVLNTIFFIFFEKYQISALNPKGLAIGFYRKTSVHDKNWTEICISTP
jgi:hypothetical protein